MIIDELTRKMAETIMKEMDAMKGESLTPDHKTRLTAIKEARTLITSLIPRLSPEDKQTLANTISESLMRKLTISLTQESRLTPPDDDSNNKQ